MSIIGFTFTKISGNRNQVSKAKIQIENNVGITDIKNSSINIDSNKSTVKIDFKYTSKFEPGVGLISLEGNLMLLLEKKEAKELVDGWKEKRLPANIIADSLNHILQKCNVQSLIMSRDLNLPSPVQMPKVNVQHKAKQGDKKTTVDKKDDSKKKNNKSNKK